VCISRLDSLRYHQLTAYSSYKSYKGHHDYYTSDKYTTRLGKVQVYKTVKTPYVSKTVKTTFTAKLTGNNEVPPVNTPATGVAGFKLSSDGKVLNYHLSTTNLKGFKDAAICEKEPVFSEGKTGETCGSVAQLSMGNGKITWQDLMGQLEDSPVSYLINIMRSGERYVNVHTQQHQNGEIRGQIS